MWAHWGDDVIGAINNTLYWGTVSLWVVLMFAGPVFLIYAVFKLGRFMRERAETKRRFNRIVKELTHE